MPVIQQTYFSLRLTEGGPEKKEPLLYKAVQYPRNVCKNVNLVRGPTPAPPQALV